MATQASSPEVESPLAPSNFIKAVPPRVKKKLIRRVEKAGDFVFLPANQPHGLKATTRFKMMLTMLRS
jgi:hypothetical protein